ncbi:MAG: hypothetical protein ABIV07_01030 [Polaromonas sp.]
MFTKSSMKLLRLTAAMTAALVFGSVAHAQTAAATEPVTRAQVKMSAVDFLKTHRYDGERGVWMLKSDVEPPAGVKSRAEVKAARDEFLSANKFSETKGWEPLKSPRDLSTMTRAQVQSETGKFLATHTFDEEQGVYVERMPGKKTK